MSHDLFGNLIVLAVLCAGTGLIARGAWQISRVRPLRGEAGERARQRCMGLVVAGCTFVSIPALVNLMTAA